MQLMIGSLLIPLDGWRRNQLESSSEFKGIFLLNIFLDIKKKKEIPTILKWHFSLFTPIYISNQVYDVTYGLENQCQYV